MAQMAYAPALGGARAAAGGCPGALSRALRPAPATTPARARGARRAAAMARASYGASQSSQAERIAKACSYEARRSYPNAQGKRGDFRTFVVQALQGALQSERFASRHNEAEALLCDALCYDHLPVPERSDMVRRVVEFYGVADMFQSAKNRPTSQGLVVAVAQNLNQRPPTPPSAPSPAPAPTSSGASTMDRLIADAERALSGAEASAPQSEEISPSAWSGASHPMILFDLETTGFSERCDRIIEIAAIDVATGARFSRLVHPGDAHVDLQENIVKLTGITPQMLLTEGVELRHALQAFSSFIEAAVESHGARARPVMMAHNGSRFDARWLSHWFPECGLERPDNWLLCDTLTVVKKTAMDGTRRSKAGRPVLDRGKLEVLMEHYGIDDEQEHRALSDCSHLQLVLEAVMDDYALSADSLLQLGRHGWPGDREPSIALEPAPPLPKKTEQQAIDETRKTLARLTRRVTVYTPLSEMKGELPNVPLRSMQKAGFHTMHDLLWHVPREYIDVEPLHDRHVDGDEVIVNGRVAADFKISQGNRGVTRATFDVQVEAGDGVAPPRSVRVTLFSNYYLLRKLSQTYSTGAAVSLRGKVNRGGVATSYNHVKHYGAFGEGPLFLPVHSDRTPLKGDKIGDHIGDVLVLMERFPEGADPLPARMYPVSQRDAFKLMHRPQTAADLDKAHGRLKFEGLVGLSLVREHTRLEALAERGLSDSGAHATPIKPSSTLASALSALPFKLTEGQREVYEEVLGDMQKDEPMNRLIQGDVGSGKTVIAYLVLMAAFGAGHQGALMAPTGVLARQLFDAFTSFADALPPGQPRPRVELLSSSTKQRERESILADLRSGEVDVLIGTHALVYGKANQVVFKSLAVAVIDEQQKFGVRDRTRLRRKNYPHPHMINMTATPIPRTLAMVQHGEIGVSQLNSTIPGRMPVATELRWDTPSVRAATYEAVRDVARGGRQAYVVFPTISSSDEESGLRSVEQTYAELTAPGGVLEVEGVRCGLLHGGLPKSEQQEVMLAFKRGEVNVLFATTMIEVGVDVDTATHIVIESPERFGFAQLHQLRGRVGRNSEQAHCVLLARRDISDDSRERLLKVEECSDGYELAMLDLEQRGPGHMLSPQQWGNTGTTLPGLAMVDWANDGDLVKRAQQAAIELLNGGSEMPWSVRQFINSMVDRLELTESGN